MAVKDAGNPTMPITSISFTLRCSNSSNACWKMARKARASSGVRPSLRRCCSTASVNSASYLRVRLLGDFLLLRASTETNEEIDSLTCLAISCTCGCSAVIPSSSTGAVCTVFFFLKASAARCALSGVAARCIGCTKLPGVGGNKRVGNFEKEFATAFGIGVQVADKNDKNLAKQVQGIKIAKPFLILGTIYYILIPFISTFLAEKAEKNRELKY